MSRGPTSGDYDPNETLESVETERFMVRNSKTGKTQGPYKNRGLAARAADRIDNKYGGYIAVVEKIKSEPIEEGILDNIKSLFKGGSPLEKEIESSPIAKSMQKDVKDYVENYVRGVVDLAKNALDIKSTEKLNQVTDGKFFELIKKSGDKADAKKTAQLSVKGAEKAIKKVYSDGLKKKIKELPGGSSHPLALAYKQGLKQIRSL